MRSHARSHVVLLVLIIALFAAPCHAMGPGHSRGIVTLSDMWNSISSLGSPHLGNASAPADIGGICPWDHSAETGGVSHAWGSPGGSSSLPIWGPLGPTTLSDVWNAFGAGNIPNAWGPLGTTDSGALCPFDH